MENITINLACVKMVYVVLNVRVLFVTLLVLTLVADFTAVELGEADTDAKEPVAAANFGEADTGEEEAVATANDGEADTGEEEALASANFGKVSVVTAGARGPSDVQSKESVEIINLRAKTTKYISVNKYKKESWNIAR